MKNLTSCHHENSINNMITNKPEGNMNTLNKFNGQSIQEYGEETSLKTESGWHLKKI